MRVALTACANATGVLADAKINTAAIKVDFVMENLLSDAAAQIVRPIEQRVKGDNDAE